MDDDELDDFGFDDFEHEAVDDRRDDARDKPSHRNPYRLPEAKFPEALPETAGEAVALVLSELFPDGVPGAVRDARFLVEHYPVDWDGESRTTVQIARQDVSRESFGSWWSPHVPASVGTFLEGWWTRMVPPGCTIHCISLRGKASALGLASATRADGEIAGRLRTAMTEAAERAAGNDLLFLEFDEDRIPRTLRANHVRERHSRVPAPGLQRLLREGKGFFGAVDGVSFGVRLPKDKLARPAFVPTKKRPDFLEAVTLRRKGGVERRYAQALVPLVVECVFLPSRRILVPRDQARALAGAADLAKVGLRPEGMVAVSHWEKDFNVFGRPAHSARWTKSVAASTIEEVRLDVARASRHPWHDDDLPRILANPEIERLSDLEWTVSDDGHGHVLRSVDSDRGIAVVPTRFGGVPCVDVMTIEGRTITLSVAMPSILLAKAVCEEVLALCGRGIVPGTAGFEARFDPTETIEGLDE